MSQSVFALFTGEIYIPLTANEEQIELAGKVVKAFTRNAAFNPDFFPNAGLNHHYQVLLAVAFNDDVPVEVQDKTLPSYAQIKKVSEASKARESHPQCSFTPLFQSLFIQRTGHLISEWNDVVADDDRIRTQMTQDVMTSNKKRPADFANDDEPDLKRKHVDGMIGKVRMREAWATMGGRALSLDDVEPDLSALAHVSWLWTS
jgi:hypothetical protein